MLARCAPPLVCDGRPVRLIAMPRRNTLARPATAPQHRTPRPPRRCPPSGSPSGHRPGQRVSPRHGDQPDRPAIADQRRRAPGQHRVPSRARTHRARPNHRHRRPAPHEDGMQRSPAPGPPGLALSAAAPEGSSETSPTAISASWRCYQARPRQAGAERPKARAARPDHQPAVPRQSPGSRRHYGRGQGLPRPSIAPGTGHCTAYPRMAHGPAQPSAAPGCGQLPGRRRERPERGDHRLMLV